MIDVYDLRLVIWAAPTVWKGRVGEKGSIDIHFRWDTLTVRVSYTGDDPYAEDSEVVFEYPITEDENSPGRGGQSCIGEDEMKEALRDICRFH
jgi:hypothetical protein